MAVTIAWLGLLARELVEHGQERLDDLLGSKPAIVQSPAVCRGPMTLVRMVPQAEEHRCEVVRVAGLADGEGGGALAARQELLRDGWSHSGKCRASCSQ